MRVLNRSTKLIKHVHSTSARQAPCYHSLHAVQIRATTLLQCATRVRHRQSRPTVLGAQVGDAKKATLFTSWTQISDCLTCTSPVSSNWVLATKTAKCRSWPCEPRCLSDSQTTLHESGCEIWGLFWELTKTSLTWNASVNFLWILWPTKPNCCSPVLHNVRAMTKQHFRDKFSIFGTMWCLNALEIIKIFFLHWHSEVTRKESFGFCGELVYFKRVGEYTHFSWKQTR
jgi:hypothetical protein